MVTQHCVAVGIQHPRRPVYAEDEYSVVGGMQADVDYPVRKTFRFEIRSIGHRPYFGCVVFRAGHKFGAVVVETD